MKVYDIFGREQTKKADAEGTLKSYDTGWVACSDWTDQHLGTAVGGYVVHNLSVPLRNLVVKIFFSTDGTDQNSFEINAMSWDWTPAAAHREGIAIDQIDDDNLVIQTGEDGIRRILSNGTGTLLDTESYYYRIVVYDMITVYSTPTLTYYETPWVACSDWTNQHLGDSVGGNVTHSLNAPLSDLIVKVFTSTDGTDDNSSEILNASYSADQYGILIIQEDADNIKIQTGSFGLIYPRDSDGAIIAISTQSWYYKIKVYKMAAVPTAVTQSRVRVTKNDAQTFTDGAVEIWEVDDVVFDSLGEWNSSTWRFTAKNAGYYQVNALMMTENVSWTVNDVARIAIYKNNALYSWLNRHTVFSTDTAYLTIGGGDIIQLAVDDYFDMRLQLTRGGNTDTYTNAALNHLTIHRLS